MSATAKYDNGALPDGWRQVRLGDICSPPEYGASVPANDYDPELPRYVRITDITDDGRLRSEDPKSAGPDLVEGYELEPGDLLFARSGSVGRTYLHRLGDEKCVFAGYLIRFRPLSDVVLPEYLEHWTHSHSYYSWVSSIARRGAQTNINAIEYSSTPILLPPLPEQRAIAAVLDSIDDAIERSEEVITATEQLRDSLLHQLLTRGVPGWHTEWKEAPGLGTIPANWEVVRLGEVATVAFSSVDKKVVEGEQEVRLCNYTDVFYNRRIRPDMDFMVATADAVERERWNLKRGDVLFTKDSETPDEIGIPAFVETDMPNVLCGYHLGRARPNPQLLDGAYLAEAIASPKLAVQLARIANGVTRFGLTLGATNQLPIPLPPLIEQQVAARLLERVDVVVAEARRERDGLHLLKESTADALLTGRVRVEV